MRQFSPAIRNDQKDTLSGDSGNTLQNYSYSIFVIY